MNRLMLFAMSVAFTVLSNPVMSQPSQLPATPLEDSHRAELIRDVSEGLTEVYVFEDVAKQMVHLINGKLERGEYDQFATLPALTD